MGNEQQQNTTSLQKSVLFTKQMVKDIHPSLLGEGVWSNAINAVNNSLKGEKGVISNEPANRYINRVPYELIGAIALSAGKWVLFSTDDFQCEIGIFDEQSETYRHIINDPALNFRRSNLITGAARKQHDCSYIIYWSDSRNPDRKLNLDQIPYEKVTKNSNRQSKSICNSLEYTDKLDLEALRLAPLVTVPQLKLSKATSGGSLPNGSYQAVIAYTVNEIRVTDYFIPSNAQSLFQHENMSGALQLYVSECDTNFEHFELVLISTVNMQTTARKVGIYSTHQRSIHIDQLKETWAAVPIEQISSFSLAYEKSDAIYAVGDYLLRTGVYVKPEINWQPLVNKIITKWVAVEVPADYYSKGANITSYLRDEVYAFFIRGIYNTSEKTACFAIPGRSAQGSDLSIASGQDVFEMQMPNPPKSPIRKWQVENTASITSSQVYDIEEGKVIMEGLMGYHESTEYYPDNNPAVWETNCGKPIRHHRMPDSDLAPIHSRGGSRIILLGVKFENIQPPVDTNGEPIKEIVGYEILRASRDGNKTIVAKGILNSIGEYELATAETGKKGLYPNFPFNDVRPNVFLSSTKVAGGCQAKGNQPLSGFNKKVFTFHSPETQFRNPFLSANELKIHNELTGTVRGSFEPVYQHPKHRLIRDLALIVAGLVGVGTGLVAIKGKKSTIRSGPRAINIGLVGGGATNITTLPTGGAAVQGYYAGKGLTDLIKETGLSAADLNDFLGKIGKTTDPAFAIGSTPGVIGGGITSTTDNTAVSELPLPLRIAGGTFLFTYFFSQGTDEALRIIRNLVPWQQYGYQMNAHGYYHTSEKVTAGNKRRSIRNSAYLEPYIQEFSDYRINNLYRSRQVVLELDRQIEFPRTRDDSRITIGDLRQWEEPSKAFIRTTSTYYASLKIPLAAQYGQPESCILQPVGTTIGFTNLVKDQKLNSPVLFGGDIYINRHTEKNIFPLFNSWLHKQPDGTEWDYNQYYNVAYPRYWINSTQYEVTNLTSSLIRFNFKENVLPNDFAQLDRPSSDCKSKISFVINRAFFYLFINGIRDYFVESEINTAHRDWGDSPNEKHYDSFGITDLQSLFRSDIIASGNYLKYDFSLSSSKLLHNYISWGQVQTRDFDALKAQNCYSYYPRRIIYSLPQQEELKKDNWSSFLANNYKDFISRVTAVQPVGANGALIFLEDRSPVQFNGVDQLQTVGGTKISIGDGGLFAQPLSSISNSDSAYCFGSCNNRLSVINTPVGLFWMSQQQGKIFQFAGELKVISDQGLQQWFNQYLPSRLLRDFPEFGLTDNPVVGIGCMSAYDSMNNLVFFCKKDFQLKEQFKGKLTYSKENVFLLRGRTKVYLGDPHYFEDASWTVSYDPKSNGWISFHDWHPQYTIAGKDHFYSVVSGKLWKHFDRCDLYCNYYGSDYPFEIQASMSAPGITVLRSIEYILECYQYDKNCGSRHHLLDFNFDRAIVFNTEQHSGLLKLISKPKNQPYWLTEAPVMIPGGVETQFTKEENKYRINGFFDITRNRSEFDDQNIPLWETEPNGYRNTINERAISYNKSALQRKKFRHYQHHVLLRRSRCNDIQMGLQLLTFKQLLSNR